MSSLGLSICIPTFNRAEVLNECLASIVPQCEFVDAEICISDNASPDNTVAIVESWRQCYPHIRFNKNVTNLRIDRNIVAAAKLATKDIIWFLSDDDILEPNAVLDVLAMVNRHPRVPAFIVNRREYDALLKSPVHEAKLLASDVGATEEIDMDISVALVALGEYLGYLPAWVIRREAWDRVEPSAFLDTDFVHVGVGIAGSHLWSKFNGLPSRIVVSNKAIIRCRLARASWRNRHYEVWIRNWQKTIHGLESYVGAKAVRESIVDVTERNYLSIVSGRGFGPYGRSDFEKFLKSNISSRLKRVIAVGVAYAPRWSARAFTRSQRFIRERFLNS